MKKAVLRGDTRELRERVDQVLIGLDILIAHTEGWESEIEEELLEALPPKELANFLRKVARVCKTLSDMAAKLRAKVSLPIPKEREAGAPRAAGSGVGAKTRAK